MAACYKKKRKRYGFVLTATCTDANSSTTCILFSNSGTIACDTLKSLNVIDLPAEGVWHCIFTTERLMA